MSTEHKTGVKNASNQLQLTAEQEAILSDTQPSAKLVLAPPGTGKTALLTKAFSRCVQKEGADSTIAITFSRKAAREIADRVMSAGITFPKGMIPIGTFHAIAINVLSIATDLALYSGPTTIADKDMINHILARISAIQPSGPYLMGSQKQGIAKSSRQIQGTLSRVKDMGYKPVKNGYAYLDGKIYDRVESLPVPQSALHNRMVAYQEFLKEENLLDYNDALYEATRLIASRRAAIFPNLKHVFIDEYQDSNWLNEMMIRALSNGIKLMALGDDDQSIHHWRGAIVQLVHDFEKNHKNAKRYILTRNFRCPPAIRIIADRLMTPIPKRISKTSEEERTNTKIDPQTVRIHEYDAPTYYNPISAGITIPVADFVAGIVDRLITRDGVAAENIAVLTRTNTGAMEIAGRIIRQGHQAKTSRPDEIAIKSVRLMGAWIALMGERSQTSSLATIASISLDGRNLQDYREKAENSYMSVADYLAEKVENKSIRSSRLTGAIKKYIEIRKIAVAQGAHIAIEKIADMILNDPLHGAMTTEDEKAFWNAYGIILNAASGDDYQKAFARAHQEYQSAVSEDGIMSTAGTVTTSTIHSMKGRQADHIILCGAVDGFLPGPQSLRAGQQSPEMEEEFRLAYVAYTRTRKTLHLITMKDKPSIILDATFPQGVPEELYETPMENEG